MATGRHNNRKKLLLNTRPKALQPQMCQSLSSKATRTLIRSHHNLQKQLRQAESRGDDSVAESLRQQINANGGLQAYQQASIQGQAADRGGDSSKVLVEWIKSMRSPEETEHGPLRLLEIGSLQVDNACARSRLFDLERIDLNSQHPDILEQDFMERPIPTQEKLREDGFDVISLSLVINYVPDAVGRGEMLRKTQAFLRRKVEGCSYLPGLFVVLPAPCLLNSRYLDEARLKDIMQALGYKQLKTKMTKKLVYCYYQLTSIVEPVKLPRTYGKQEIHRGKSMNNFAIVLK